jgi:hypothetical protein
MEADYEYYVTEVMDGINKKCKVSYRVRLGVFSANIDWTPENYENFYSAGAKQKIRNCDCKNPKSQWDPALKIEKDLVPNRYATLENEGTISRWTTISNKSKLY